jgi:hypothetical protein
MTTRTPKKVKVEVTPPVVEESAENPFEAFIEHQRKAFVEAGRAIENLIPVASRKHGRSAFKEFIDGYRSLFNTALDEVVDAIEKVKFQTDEGVEKVTDRLEKAKFPANDQKEPV